MDRCRPHAEVLGRGQRARSRAAGSDPGTERRRRWGLPGVVCSASPGPGRDLGEGEQRRDRLYADEFVLVNRIEAQFTALRYFALDGTDHARHKEEASMIRRCIIWRNNHAYDERLRRIVVLLLRSLTRHVSQESARRGTRITDEETRRPAGGYCRVLTDAWHGELRSLCGRVFRSVIALLEAADHNKPGDKHGHHRDEQR